MSWRAGLGKSGEDNIQGAGGLIPNSEGGSLKVREPHLLPFASVWVRCSIFSRPGTSLLIGEVYSRSLLTLG